MREIEALKDCGLVLILLNVTEEPHQKDYYFVTNKLLQTFPNVCSKHFIKAISHGCER